MSRAARNAIIEPMQTGTQGAEEWSVTIATCVLSPHSATKTAMKTRRTTSCASDQVEEACLPPTLGGQLLTAALLREFTTTAGGNPYDRARSFQACSVFPPEHQMV